MATQKDVRRIALALPETEESPDRFAFSVRNKGTLKGSVLLRLPAVTVKELNPIIYEARSCQAPKELVARQAQPKAKRH